MPHYFSFLKSKKAMEMSLNTVIVAVIALLVLGLMIFVLARNTDVFNKGTKCTTYGGRCVAGSSCLGKGETGSDCSIIGDSGANNLCNTGEVCCSIVPGQGKKLAITNGDTIIQGPACNN